MVSTARTPLIFPSRL